MSLVPLTANTNRAIDPVASDVKDVQQNVFPQELLAAKCTPQGFLVIPKIVRVGAQSSKWTRSGTWGVTGVAAFLEDQAMRQDGATNSFMEITIRARAFRLAFRGDTDKGIANITIDGSNPSSIGGVTMEDGSAALNTVDTYRAAAIDRIFVGYKGLSAAAHTVRITVSGTKNAASSGFNIGVEGTEYVDILCDAADGVACNQVLILPHGDREDMVDPGDTAAITYVGSWSNTSALEHLMGRRRESSTAADYFEITFTGTGIVLFFYGDGSSGFLDITVDAAPVAQRWTTYFPSAAHFNYPFPILGLASGSHTVRVAVNATNENGGNKLVSFAGFFVVKDAADNGYGGVLVSGEKRWNKTGLDSATMPAADASNPRKDLLVVNKSGVFSVIQGTAAAAPAGPTEPTDDRVSLAVLCQEKSGVILQRLHVAAVANTVDPESDDDVLRQVQDRRRGILSSFGEVPLVIVVSGATNTVSTPFRLPAKAKRVRARKDGGAAADRGAIRVFGSSPARQREFEGGAATVDGFVNVDGYGGLIVELLIATATSVSFRALSVT